VDRWVPFDALDVVVPGLSSYRPGAVAIGMFAMYGAAVVHASFGWRKKIGVRAWRALHFTAFAVFVTAVAHGLVLGSAATRPIYSVAVAIVLALVVLRIVLVVAGRRSRPAIA
jgi:sulfoxide reductase heme-binding subunit YedZ